MNAPFRPSFAPPRPHLFTVDDVFAMQDKGILPDDHHLELIEGELIEMPSEGDLHSYVKANIITWFARALDLSQHRIGPDTSLFLSNRSAPEPDMFVHSASLRPSQVKGPDALLVVEVAASSAAYDKGRKAQVYAGYGVQEYWVLDVEARIVRVHRGPGAGGWASVEDLPFTAVLQAQHVPHPPLVIADLS
jgi:Uma2 family endonuclease